MLNELGSSPGSSRSSFGTPTAGRSSSSSMVSLTATRQSGGCGMRTVRRRPHRRRRRRAGLRGAARGRRDGVAARGGVHSGRHRVAPLRTQAVRRQSAEAPDSHRRGEVDRWPRRSASRSRCPACRARLLAPWSSSTRGGRSPRARSRRREYRSAVEYRHRSRAPKSPGPRPRRTPRPRSHPFRRRRRGVRHRLVDAQDDLADRDLVRAAPLHELARYPTCDRYRVRRRWKLPQFVSHLGGGYPIAGWPGEPASDCGPLVLRAVSDAATRSRSQAALPPRCGGVETSARMPSSPASTHGVSPIRLRGATDPRASASPRR
jgi:hypothetical protein